MLRHTNKCFLYKKFTATSKCVNQLKQRHLNGTFCI